MKNISKTDKFKTKSHLKTHLILGCFIITSLLLYSCDNNDGSSPEQFDTLLIEEAQEIAEIDDTNENINEIIESMYLEIATSDFFKSSEYKSQIDRRFLSDCVLISKELKDGYMEVILDYGEGCTTKKQHEAKGKIIIRVDPIIEDLSVNISYSFDNFYINDKKIEGNVTKIRSRNNDNGNPQSQITKDIKIIWEDDTYSKINGQRTREWIDGNDNEIWSDNVFSVTGYWTIMKRNGTVSASNIIEPLIRTLACRFIISGLVEIKTDDTIRQLNYGNGACDDKVTVTKDGKSYEIQIRRQKSK